MFIRVLIDKKIKEIIEFPKERVIYAKKLKRNKKKIP